MEDSNYELQVLDPTPERHGGEAVKTARRLDTMEGKTIGLLWNGKANGDLALKEAAARIEERIPNVQFRLYSGSMPCSPALLAKLAEECDAAIACTAD